MLLPNDKKPKFSLYYVGGLILKTLSENTNHDFFDVYDAVNKNYGINIKLYILAIDWLYLANIVELNKEGGLTYVH